MRAFTPEETAMIEALQRGELRGEGLRNAAQLVSGKLGQALSLGGGLVGMKHGGLLEGVAGYVGGSVVEPVLSRFLQSWGNQLGADAVDRLTRAIRARSPLGQELAQKVSTYNDAQSALFRQPTTTTLGTLAHTSRELSLSLRRLGVDIRPPQLMGGTKADEDKDQVPRPPSQ